VEKCNASIRLPPTSTVHLGNRLDIISDAMPPPEDLAEEGPYQANFDKLALLVVPVSGKPVPVGGLNDPPTSESR
jgi:hypothetical protein